MQTEILVIGAGVAGLTAGRVLAEAGRQVMVVEARSRIGGRVLTVEAEGEPVELGAEFVHGRPPELWALIEEAGLRAYELDGEELCRSEDGGRLEPCARELEADFDWIERLKGWGGLNSAGQDTAGQDCSFAEYLEHAQVPEEQRVRLIRYVEGFNAADHRQISAMALGRQQEAEDAIEADRLFQVEGGYRQVPEFLAGRLEAAGGRILLEHAVAAVAWEQGSARIDCSFLGDSAGGGLMNGGLVSIEAQKVIVTLPLGVLQAGVVRWSPEPAAILEAAAGMRMGQARRAVLRFRESPVGQALAHVSAETAPEGEAEMRRFGFLFAYGKVPPVWWTQYPHRSATLTGWVGGPRTEAWNGLPESEVRRDAVATLAELLGADADALDAALAGCHTHDWQRDPFALGAYSYVATGAIGASAQMCEPQRQTLFFAGEHTDTTGHWGTVHGAMRSGLRVAAQVLAAQVLSA